VEAIDQREKRRTELDYRTKQQGSIESATKQKSMEAAKTKGRWQNLTFHAVPTVYCAPEGE